MTHTNQLFVVAIVMFLLGMYIDHLLVVRHIKQRSKIINKKSTDNVNSIIDSHRKTKQENIDLTNELVALKIWATDADIYMEELELENLALGGTKSKATLIPSEVVPITKETKKVVHKRTRKAK